MIDRRFYVYVHKRKDTGVVFYVGKGSGKRAWVKCNKKNAEWKRISEEAGYDVEILKDGLTEQEAESLEYDLICNQLENWQLSNITMKSTGIKKIDIQTISEFLSYSPESPTGLVWVKPTCKATKIGSPAGSMKHSPNGDPHKCVVSFKGSMFTNHRIIYFMHNPFADQSLIVNHKDCNPFNNRIENLELISKADNNRKTSQQVLGKPRSNNTSGIVGVSYDKRQGYIIAYITLPQTGFIRKCFSVNKLGYNCAFEEAVAWRKSKLNIKEIK